VAKLLLFFAVAVVVYLVLRSLNRSHHARESNPPEARIEQMVPCAHCGVNLPRSEALESRGRFYCSDEHRRLDPG
jgi:uncharacterized protein